MYSASDKIPPYLGYLDSIYKHLHWPRKGLYTDILSTINYASSGANRQALVDISTCIECVVLGSWVFQQIQQREAFVNSNFLLRRLKAKLSEKYIILSADFLYSTA
jgi:hypothetical protein